MTRKSNIFGSTLVFITKMGIFGTLLLGNHHPISNCVTVVDAFAIHPAISKVSPIIVHMSQSSQQSPQGDNDEDIEWNEQYSRLQQFFQQFGHTRVEKLYHKNRENTQLLILMRWVQKQRLEAYNFPQELSFEKRIKLEAVGIFTSDPNAKKSKPREYPVPPLFVVDPMTNRKIYASQWEQRWEDMYDRLCQFVKQYGFADCNNQEGYRIDQRLADWVQIQRENLNLGMVRHDRRHKLQTIGVTPLVMSTRRRRDEGSFE